MTKIEQLRIRDFSNPATAIYKLNELIDAVNKLQEHREAQKKENSLVYEEIENLRSKLVEIDHVTNTGNMVDRNSCLNYTVDNQTERDAKNAQPTRTPLDDLVDEIDDLYPIEEERQITIRKTTLRKILERYFR